jgi:hypothetical protein
MHFHDSTFFDIVFVFPENTLSIISFAQKLKSGQTSRRLLLGASSCGALLCRFHNGKSTCLPLKRQSANFWQPKHPADQANTAKI